MENISGGVCAPKGFKAAGVHVGIKKTSKKKDMALIFSLKPCSVAGVYTKNKVKGAPVTVSQKNMAGGVAQAIICNSGNANTCASNGIEIAEQTCLLTAKALGISQSEVMVASTGVIGEPMSIEPFEKGIPELVKNLSFEGSNDAAAAIMTTDTVKKEAAVKFTIGEKECTIGAVAKGSGMINPNMATMLSFITTDVNITSKMLQQALSADTEDTFNQISIDGDTSTNDTVFMLANGMAENEMITDEGEEFSTFCQALSIITTTLSRMLAKDGEGATKLVVCEVQGAPDKETAKIVSKAVINSNLLKAAMFGEDANWGRILCAIGYTDCEFDISGTDVSFVSKAGRVKVCENAAYKTYDEKEAKKVLHEEEITIEVDLKRGNGQAAAWGCDLTYDYVKINGDYRS